MLQGCEGSAGSGSQERIGGCCGAQQDGELHRLGAGLGEVRSGDLMGEGHEAVGATFVY